MSTKIQIKAQEYDKNGNILLTQCILTPTGIKTNKYNQMKIYHTEEYRCLETRFKNVIK